MFRSGRTSFRRSSRRSGVVGAFGAILALSVLVGCSAGDADEDAGRSDAQYDAPLSDHSDAGAAEEPADEAAGADGDPAARAGQLSQASLAAERRQIMTAGLVVETDSVLSAARQAETIAVGAGGFVTDEDTQVEQRDGADEDAATVSSLTVRVPPSALDDVLGRLAGLGTLISQNRATTDVTDEYVDVQARLDSQRASLDRLLQLVGTAGDLDDVIALENEIARRQADLDGLAARLQSLEEQTDLATIALTLTSEPDAVVKTEDEEGFLAGLDSGWQAFTGAIVAGLTVVGALLPFAILVALVGLPFLLLRRRRATAVAGGADGASAPPAAQA